MTEEARPVMLLSFNLDSHQGDYGKALAFNFGLVFLDDKIPDRLQVEIIEAYRGGKAYVKLENQSLYTWTIHDIEDLRNRKDSLTEEYQEALNKVDAFLIFQ